MSGETDATAVYDCGQKLCRYLRRMCMAKGISDGGGTMPNESTPFPPDYNNNVIKTTTKNRSEWQYVVQQKTRTMEYGVLSLGRSSSHPSPLHLNEKCEKENKSIDDVITRTRRDRKKAPRYLWQSICECVSAVPSSRRRVSQIHHTLMCFAKVFYFSYAQPERQRMPLEE